MSECHVGAYYGSFEPCSCGTQECGYCGQDIPAVPIDVERLARAMDNAWDPDDEFIDDVMMWREFAAKVVAVYAADES